MKRWIAAFLLWGVGSMLYATPQNDSIIVKCWFDQNTNLAFQGRLAGGQLLIDADTLSDGFHVLNILIGSDSTQRAQNFLFYKPFAQRSYASTLAYTCWFDQNLADAQTGTLQNGILLNTDALSEGYHTVNLRIGTGTEARLQNFIFYKPFAQPSFASTLAYTCWFDQNLADAQTGTLQNGILLNTDALSEGYHTVNLRIGTGAEARLQNFIFYKPFAQRTYSSTISCTYWFDQDLSRKRTATLQDGIVLFDVSNLGSGYHDLYMQLGSGQEARLQSIRFLQDRFFPVIIEPSGHGEISISSNSTVIGAGEMVQDSSTVTITATPMENYSLQYLIVNGDTVLPPHSLVVTDTLSVRAVYILNAPELHVTSIACSDVVAGQNLNVSWTVQNDGNAATPVGVQWHDRLYLSAVPFIVSGSADVELLGIWENVSALAPGEGYTRNATVQIPLRHGTGEYYLFVLTDAQNANNIQWEDGSAPASYNPPPFVSASGDAGNVAERSEIENPGTHDNFNFSKMQVSLPPLADLEVVRVIHPNNLFSGSEVTVSATVANAGAALTLSSGWRDVLYISHQPYLNDSALLLASVWHDASSPLAPGSSYQTSLSGSIPLSWYGESYFIVATDVDDSEYEHIADGNNIIISSVVNVILTPPADLVVSSVRVPARASNQNPFSLNYVVSNLGMGTPDFNSWYDRVFLSSSTTPSDTNRVWVLLDEIYHSGGLAAGSDYEVERTYSIPSGISQSGTYYIIVVTDARKQVFEYQSENNNNQASGPISVAIFTPDFVPSDLHLPDTISVGYPVTGMVTVHNRGHKDFLGNVPLRCFYSTTPSLVGAYQLATPWYYASLPVGTSLGINFLLGIPGALQDGDYYVHLVVNPDSVLAEESVENNTITIGPLRFTRRPLPDLVVHNVSISDTLQSGQEAVVSFDVTNAGTITELGVPNVSARKCYTHIAVDGNWCPVQSQSSPLQPGFITIAQGETVHFEQTIMLPPTITNGNQTFVLSIDAANAIQETNENNNSVTFNSYVKSTTFDIEVREIEAPASYTTGDTLVLAWTVAVKDAQSMWLNGGTTMRDAIGYNGMQYGRKVRAGLLWSDAIFLSADNTLSGNDIPLGSADVRASHLRDSIYRVQLSAVTPHQLAGNLYLIAKSDRMEKSIESNVRNNVHAKAISATQAPLPNLRISELLFDDTVTQRQGVLVIYTVVNDGEAATNGAEWQDAFYIGGHLAASVTRTGSLDVGESYTDSAYLVVPDNLPPLSVLMAKTDDNNNVYEHLHEDDNTMARQIVVSPALPCDLVVTNAAAPATAIAGSVMDIAWTVQNSGENPIGGRVKDGVYLSADTLFDNSDVMIGEFSYNISLAPYGSLQKSGACTVKNVVPGDYYVIVRTNIMNAFREVSFANNARATTSTVEISLPTLVIGQAESVTLSSGADAYYRMEVGPEYAGQTLALTLTTEAANAYNGLFLLHEQVPSQARYNYASAVPYASEQRILVPVLDQGSYYILASATTTNGTSQQLVLLAEIVDFEVIELNTASGTNTGSVTTKVVGAKFDTIMDFRLRNGDVYSPAQKVLFEGSTQTFVTFNLTDLPSGTYHVEAELPGGVVTMKENAFVVEDGLPAELSVKIVAPSSVRSGNTATVNIEYGNTGATDINVSGFLVVSANGHPIALTAAALSENDDSLTFSTAEPGMDPDILRPGFIATKTVYVNASSTQPISLYVYPIRRRYE